jgi:hypothetical protein
VAVEGLKMTDISHENNLRKHGEIVCLLLVLFSAANLKPEVLCTKN